jgi:hypothetical protein
MSAITFNSTGTAVAAMRKPPFPFAVLLFSPEPTVLVLRLQGVLPQVERLEDRAVAITHAGLVEASEELFGLS